MEDIKKLEPEACAADSKTKSQELCNGDAKMSSIISNLPDNDRELKTVRSAFSLLLTRYKNSAMAIHIAVCRNSTVPFKECQLGICPHMRRDIDQAMQLLNGNGGK
jgi:hypothetical protein